MSVINTGAMGVPLLIGAITYDIFASESPRKMCLTVQDGRKRLLEMKPETSFTGAIDARG